MSPSPLSPSTTSGATAIRLLPQPPLTTSGATAIGSGREISAASAYEITSSFININTINDDVTTQTDGAKTQSIVGGNIEAQTQPGLNTGKPAFNWLW